MRGIKSFVGESTRGKAVRYQEWGKKRTKGIASKRFSRGEGLRRDVIRGEILAQYVSAEGELKNAPFLHKTGQERNRKGGWHG